MPTRINAYRIRSMVAILAAAALLAGAGSAFADIYIYWQGFGGTWQVGSVSTSTVAIADDDSVSTSGNIGTGESHIAIVCSSGRCGLVEDCKSCHTSPKRFDSFNRRVLELHRSTHFPRATIQVGTTPVPFENGFVQMAAGRMVLLDKDRTPTHRLPSGARLLRDTRTGQPLFIVYDGRTAPESIVR